MQEARVQSQTETISKLQDQLFAVSQSKSPQITTGCSGLVFQPLKHPFVHKISLLGRSSDGYFNKK